MRKILAALVLTFALAGCAQQIQDVKNAYTAVTTATVTPQQVYIAANAYDAVEASAANYLRLPVCGNFPCRNPNATKGIVSAVRSARLARNRLEAAVSAIPGAPVDANLFATLTGSTATLKAILQTYGVQ